MFDISERWAVGRGVKRDGVQRCTDVPEGDDGGAAAGEGGGELRPGVQRCVNVVDKAGFGSEKH